MGSISTPTSWVPGTVGPLETCVECKLVDVPHLGYFTNTVPPQGQILLRGPCVTSGYLDREEETVELFDKDGWLRTGDVGEFDSCGRLRIIDRMKNLVKTLHGEYIALEKLESVYKISRYVLSLCIYADLGQTKPIAIVVPVESEVRSLAMKLSLASTEASMESLVENTKVLREVHMEMLSIARAHGLRGVELIQAAVLVAEDWTPENLMLTAARKLNRKNIVDRYEERIKASYAQAVDS